MLIHLRDFNFDKIRQNMQIRLISLIRWKIRQIRQICELSLNFGKLQMAVIAHKLIEIHGNGF